MEISAEQEDVFFRISVSLARDFECIYYVDLKNDSFIRYGASYDATELKELERGDDFFAVIREELEKEIYEEDKKIFSETLKRDALLEELESGLSYILHYRKMIKDKPVYFELKIICGQPDEEYLVVAIRNVDKKMRRKQELLEEKEKSSAFSNIARILANKYEAVYYIDAETNHYETYSATKEYKKLGLLMEGEDFFSDMKKELKRIIHEQDYPFVEEAYDREILLEELDKGLPFSLTYRLMMGENAVYVNLRARWLDDMKHIIIALTNVDAQVRGESEYMKALISSDYHS